MTIRNKLILSIGTATSIAVAVLGLALSGTDDGAGEALADSKTGQKNKPQFPSLPGWDDLVIGKVPPNDMQATCETHFKDSKVSTCKACRSQKLPFPCLRVGTGGDGRVMSIGFELPPNYDKKLKDLYSLWGNASGWAGVPEELFYAGPCWTTKATTAAVIRTKYNLDGTPLDAPWRVMISNVMSCAKNAR